jgi:hypothetical protein
MTNGINTDGFSATGEQSGSNTIDANYASNPGSAFPAQDKSSQGNAGLKWFTLQQKHQHSVQVINYVCNVWMQFRSIHGRRNA